MLIKIKPAVQLNTYDNSWYAPGSKFRRSLWILTSTFFNYSLAVFNGFKCTILRWFGAKVGRGVVIKTQ